MITIDKVTNIIIIILVIIYILGAIFIYLINEKDLFKSKKYYRIEYYYDYKYTSTSIVKAKTPKQAIKKLIYKHKHGWNLNEITDVISCTEVDFYKCLKEVEKNENS